MHRSKNPRFRLFGILVFLLFLLGILTLVFRSDLIGMFASGSLKVADESVQGDGKMDAKARSSNLTRTKTPKASPFKILKRPRIELLDRSGKITDEAALFLDISETERIQTQEVINRHFETMKSLIAPTVIVTENKEKTLFYIPALDDRGEKEIESFQNDLAAILREERTKKLLISLPINEYFGGFGQFDVAITITPRSNNSSLTGHASDLAMVEYTDPSTGKLMVRNSTSTSEIPAWFPGVFDFPH